MEGRRQAAEFAKKNRLPSAEGEAAVPSVARCASPQLRITEVW